MTDDVNNFFIPSDPEEIKKLIGNTAKYQKANVLVHCRGKVHKLGWLQFGADGSFYFQFHMSQPVRKTGLAIEKDGLIQPLSAGDLSNVPDERLTNLHFSLHPRGACHLRSEDRKPIAEANVGEWLPLEEPKTLAYVHTPPIQDLPVRPLGKAEKFSDRVFKGRNPEGGLRVTITLLPPDMIVRARNDALLGLSKRFNVLVTFQVVPPTAMGFHFATGL